MFGESLLVMEWYDVRRSQLDMGGEMRRCIDAWQGRMKSHHLAGCQLR